MKERISILDWPAARAGLHEKGYALLPGLLTAEECHELAGLYTQPLYRKTVNMARYRFGSGEYKYFNYPLPPLPTAIRQWVYPQLAPLANQWMELLGMPQRYPHSLAAFLELCHSRGQQKPAVLILKYSAGGYNTLHQDLYGELHFPLQLVLFLNEPGADYHGGEFVMLQQTPRAQSEAIVLSPRRGDMLLFSTSFRPVKGTRGYYRMQMKHGVSRLHEGSRHTLGILFHDAAS